MLYLVILAPAALVAFVILASDDEHVSECDEHPKQDEFHSKEHDAVLWELSHLYLGPICR